MAPKNSPNVAAAAEAAKTLPAPPLNIEPTNLLPTSIARTYSHVHPVLVFGLFMSSFSALVFDPVTSLTTLLPPLAVLQAVYCILCLPPQHGEQLHGQSPQAHSNSNGNASSSRKKTGASIVRGSTLTSRVIVCLLIHPVPDQTILKCSIKSAPVKSITHYSTASNTLSSSDHNNHLSHSHNPCHPPRRTPDNPSSPNSFTRSTSLSPGYPSSLLHPRRLFRAMALSGLSRGCCRRN